MVGLALTGVALLVARLAERGLERTRADRVVVGLLGRVVRVLLIALAVLVGLSVAGVAVGPALAGLGVAGLALGLAVQGIIENFVAGVILILRRPFREGDQIIICGTYEGTVATIDLRVTQLIDYDGEKILIPNAEVYKNAIVNLTHADARRTRVVISVDYRDDQDRAREVIHEAVGGVAGVHDEPAPQVFIFQLGESSVDFEIRYWTAPDIGSVWETRDRVLSAAKRALEDDGITIPWPIRTLSFDNAVQVGRDGASS